MKANMYMTKAPAWTSRDMAGLTGIGGLLAPVEGDQNEGQLHFDAGGGHLHGRSGCVRHLPNRFDKFLHGGVLWLILKLLTR